MKKGIKVTLKFLLFFIAWSILISLFIYEPSFAKESPALLRLWFELIPLALTVFMSLIFVYIVERKNQIKISLSQNLIKDTVIGTILGLFWIISVLGIANFLGILRIGKYTSVNSLYIWILAILLNVAMQELMMRGYLFSLVEKNYNKSIATITTTILFVLMHGGAFEAGFIAVLNVFTTSILLSIILIYTKGLVVPILMHFMWNCIDRLVGVVSLAGDYPEIFNSYLSGVSILSGGDAKIEGSIIVLIFNILLILGIVVYYNYKNNKVKNSLSTYNRNN